MKNTLNILTAALVLLNAGAVPSHAADWKPAQAPLMTRWAKEVSPTNALPEYPRPQIAFISRITCTKAPTDPPARIEWKLWLANLL